VGLRTPPRPLGGVFALHPPCPLRIAESPTDRAEKAGSRRHDLHAPGTRPLSGRLFRHGNVIRISAICAGMPPLGTRGQDRAASQNHAGNGAGLGEARQGDRRGRRSRLALTAFCLRVWQVPLACETKPNLRHVQQGGPGFRVMERARHLQALGGVASTLVGSPHWAPSADLAQRGSATDVPVASGAFTRFSRALSRRAGRRPVVWVPKCNRDTGGGAPLGDRMSNPARVASRRGSSSRIAECSGWVRRGLP